MAQRTSISGYDGITGRDWKTFQNHDAKFPRPDHERSHKDSRVYFR